MIEQTVFRLMIATTVPIASALVMEQLPKNGVADVPFAFQVGEHALPPGTYSVKQADLGRTVRIQNENVADAGMQYVTAKRKFGKANGARLVFDGYGGHYYLSEIWFDADGRGLVLDESRAEQKAGSPTGSKNVTREVKYIRFQ